MKIRLTLLLLIIGFVAYSQRVTLTIPNGHAKNIDAITFSPNGKFMASISYKTVIIWDVESRKKLHEISLNVWRLDSKANAIDITDNLDKVVSCGEGGLYCYNIQTGKEIFNDTGIHDGAKFSKDGSKVFAINYGSVFTLDAETGKRIENIQIPNHARECKIYELGNNKLLVLYYYGWSIINTETKEVTFIKEIANGKDERLENYVYSQKDNLIIANTEKSMRSFDPMTGVVIKNKPIATPFYSLAVTDKHQVVTIGYDVKLQSYKVEILNNSDFTTIKSTLQPEIDVPESIYYARNALHLSGTNKIIYTNYNQLWAYDMADGSLSNTFTNRIADFESYYFFGNFTHARPMADNQLSIATDGQGVMDFDMENFKPKTYISTPPKAIFSHDGKLVAGIGKNIIIKTLVDGKPVKTLALPAGVESSAFFFFSYDNKSVICADVKQGNLLTINISTGISSILHSFGIPYSFIYPSASFDGKYFATTVDAKITGDHKLQVLDLQTRKLILNKTAKSEQVAFLNDSYYLFVFGTWGDFSIHNAENPAYKSDIIIKHRNKIKVLGGDIKNNIIALGEVGVNQMGAYKISLMTLEGKLIREFESKDNNDFLKVTFSKDDKIMFTPTTQKGVQVWKTDTGELLGTYYFIEKTNEYIFVSTEGLFDGSVEGIKELYFVKNNKQIPLENLYEQFYTPDLLRRKINGEKFSPPDVANLHDAPKVKISYASLTRNIDQNDQSPNYQNTTGLAEISVAASATDDKIDEIRLFHNGKIVNLATRGLFISDETTGKETKKYTINLLAGQNTFRAVALNTQRTESKADQISVSYQASGQNNTPVVNVNGVPIDAVDKNATMHLIVVGINKYQNEKMSLNYALADATAFKDEIEKDAKSVLADVKTYFVTDGNADKKGITNAFAEVQKTAKAQDIFVFYYAGHGVISEKNKEFYLVPTDVADLKNVDAVLVEKGIPSKMLQGYAVDIQAQKQVFILDACQSAGAFEQLMTDDGNQQKSLAVVARSTGTHWMAASGSKQFANEFATLGHGAFTYVLLNALKGQAAANKMITVNGLKVFMQVQVPELMKKYGGSAQYPASYGFGNDFPVEVLK